MLREKKLDLHEKIFILTPFSVYFGWITVATVANITTFLVSIRWYGFGIAEQNWTVIILVVAAIIGILRILRDQNIIYGLVFIWAYIGIFVKHVSPNEFDSEYTPVITAAPITIVMLAITNIYIYLKNKAPKKRLS